MSTDSPARRRRQRCSIRSTTRVTANGLADTAQFIMDPAQAHSSPFYSVTLKNFATPWTNRDQTVFAPLNDYTATVIGMVRDDKDFRGMLSDDIVYVGSGVTPAYSTTEQRALRGAGEQQRRSARGARSSTHSRRSTACRPRRPPASLPRARRRRRSSSTARTARCSASRC